MTDVSLIIPAKDEADKIPELLESIANQTTSVEFEVIVVDDSVDDTRAVVTSFADRVAFDVMVISGTGRGVSAARNEGAAIAEGTWLGFVDADSWLDPMYVEKMFAFVIGNDLDAATSYCRFEGSSRWRDVFVTWVMNHVCLTNTNRLWGGFNVFVNADSFKEVGKFPETHLEDVRFVRRIERTGDIAVLAGQLVTTSSRRIEDVGIVGAFLYYLHLWGKELRQ